MLKVVAEVTRIRTSRPVPTGNFDYLLPHFVDKREHEAKQERLLGLSSNMN